MRKHFLLLWSFTVSLGGFLFGFDTAVISGAEQAIQGQWALSDALLGQMVAMALYGTVLGALLGGIPADRWGRRMTLFVIAVLYFVSAAGSALAPDIYWLMFFRFIGGLGIGASSVAAPMYVAEISPADKRGRLTALFQFNIVLGILIAYLSNYLIGTDGPQSWRVMLGVEAAPAAIFTALILLVPESPRWLAVKKGDTAAAQRILDLVSPGVDAKEIARLHSQNPAGSSSWRAFVSGKYRLPILLAFLIAAFNQLSGINAVIYYAPRIFEMTGMGSQTALLSSAGIGLVNLIFTMAGLALIDRMGRRFLMFVGSAGYILSLGMVALAFFTGQFQALATPFWLFVFIAAHAIGQGAVIWVFISEIFPNEVRAFGQSLGSSTHWVLAAIVAGAFPLVAKSMGGGPVFAFFAGMMLLQLLFVWRMMPETRGATLEEIESRLSGRAS